MTMKLTRMDTHMEVLRPEVGIQVEFREDGKVLWVNVDGICVLRVAQIPKDPTFVITLAYPAGWDKNLVTTGDIDEARNQGKAAQVGGGKTVTRSLPNEEA